MAINRLAELDDYARKMRRNYELIIGVEELCTCILAYIILIKREGDKPWMKKLKACVNKAKKESKGIKVQQICRETIYLLR